MNGLPFEAIARKAFGALFDFPTPAGSSGGPRRTKSLYMTSRRFTPKPDATNLSSRVRAWTNTTSTSPASPSLSAFPVPTATTSTLQPNFYSKGGRSTDRSPEFSVEVVVDIRSRSSARAGRAARTRRRRRSVVPRARVSFFIGRPPFLDGRRRYIHIYTTI